MTNKFLILFIICCIFSGNIAISQDLIIQKGYFQYPFNPGKPNSLSGSMGELRTNHFHGGMDVRTSGTIGLPILAAADGYISKIIISSYSYGNMLYITHPNGFITVYAHLDKFYKKIADYTLAKQYALESFDVELTLQKNELIIAKGDTIGLSGNTGASRGPHLHFEVRDAKNRMYNPLLWGFPEIKDNIAPVFDRIAIRTFDKQSRVDDAFGRTEYKPIKKNGIYQTPAPITVWGTIGIEIQSHDMMNLTANMMGISYLKLKFDNKEIFYHDVTSYGFEENRYINAKIDYETLMRRGVRFERCYIADGDKLSTYKRYNSNGKISINDEKTHTVEIIIGDVMGNNSTLQIKLIGKKPNPPTSIVFVKKSKLPQTTTLELFENILKITAPQKADLKCKIYIKGKAHLSNPDYFKNGQSIYLHDMRKGIADSIEVNNVIKKTNYQAMIPSGKALTFLQPGFKITFPSDCLFDTLYTQYAHGLDAQKREVFQMNDLTVPMFSQPSINITPSIPVLNKPFAFGYNANRWPQFEGGSWAGNSITFKSKNLGKYIVQKDTVNPVITFKYKLKEVLYFQISDGQSGIGSFKANLNGAWILMNFDHKRRLIWTELKDKNQLLKGDFVLEVKDKAGNINKYTNKY